MSEGDQSDQAVRDSLSRGDLRQAVGMTIDRYGPELFGFLVGVLGQLEASETAYAHATLQIASELAEFRWRCSLRAWTYWIARRELADRRRRGGTRQSPSVKSPDPVTTESNRPVGVSLLRRSLREEDRELLILCVDRRLDWRELAITALGEDAPLDLLDRESHRLRSRVDEVLRDIRRRSLQLPTAPQG
jgi:DNA-directed RNA polymerase specialized sigma24 family protein